MIKTKYYREIEREKENVVIAGRDEEKNEDKARA